MLKEIKILTETKGDRLCPFCRKKDIVLQDHKICHARTELKVMGYCSDCGCNFTFIYNLFVSGVEYT